RITEMILEGVVDDAVLQIAVRHHEKLDGSGYHKGLTGDQLTLPQQIVAVADILSALYGKRSYKDSFSSELIQKIMTEDAENNKINKTAVETLIRNYDKVIAEFEKEKENTIGLYLEIKEQYAIISERFEAFNN
ncbi:MAG: phosphohydrolase, partial [Lachnospiraceae bacterium]|nr:phosphohydrolase [Lachnospiraceae bacterium]